MPLIIRHTGTFEGHRDAIYNLQPAEDGIISCGADGLIVKWDVGSGNGKAIASFQQPVYGLLALEQTNLLAAGLKDGTVVLLGFESDSILLQKRVHEKAIFDFAWDPLRRQLYASAADGTVSSWAPDLPEQTHFASVSSKSIRTITVLPDSSLLAGSSDNHIYHLTPGLREISKWDAHSRSVFRVIPSPDGDFLFSAGLDARLRKWDLLTGRELAAVPAHQYAINDLIFNPEGTLLLSASMDKSIRIWDPENMELLKAVSYQKHGSHPFGVNRLLWHQGRLFSCGDCRKVHIWEVSES